MEYLLDRLKEPSSYAGLAGLLGVVGINLDPGLLQQIVIVATAVAGLVAFLVREKK